MDADLQDILGRLRIRAEEKRERGRAAVDAEFAADIQSINRLTSLGLSGSATAEPRVVVDTPVFSAQGKRVGGRKNGPVAKIRQVLKTINSGVFTAGDIADRLSKAGHHVSRPALYNSINKLQKTREIEKTASPAGGTVNYYHLLNLKSDQGGDLTQEFAT